MLPELDLMTTRQFSLLVVLLCGGIFTIMWINHSLPSFLCICTRNPKPGNIHLKKAVARQIALVIGLYLLLLIPGADMMALLEADFSKGVYLLPMTVVVAHLRNVGGVLSILNNYDLHPGDSIDVGETHGMFVSANMGKTQLCCPRTGNIHYVSNDRFRAQEVTWYGPHGRQEEAHYVLDPDSFDEKKSGLGCKRSAKRWTKT